MHFQHTHGLWTAHPDLAAGALYAADVRGLAPATGLVEQALSVARQRLATQPETEWPPIQAWRRAFSRMGLKPTQYRCAAESLLRRLRKEGALPALHPLVDLCNALSVACAIPVAVFDLDAVSGSLEVRHASGTERYTAFDGTVEHAEPQEVVFVDEASQAHARRWTHRQSGLSAVQPSTRRVLVVAEALHEGAAADVAALLAQLAAALAAAGCTALHSRMLSVAAPRFDWHAGPVGQA